tara:strand:+ start:7926 stop:8105 length:180 start_codon:yes stop_codon:yes gene_type:complete
MTKNLMIQKITVAIKETHNAQDIADLQTMSRVELKEILYDLYFGEEFIQSDDKGTLKEY